jgi:hypothetical protein
MGICMARASKVKVEMVCSLQVIKWQLFCEAMGRVSERHVDGHGLGRSCVYRRGIPNGALSLSTVLAHCLSLPALWDWHLIIKSVFLSLRKILKRIDGWAPADWWLKYCAERCLSVCCLWHWCSSLLMAFSWISWPPTDPLVMIRTVGYE